MDQRFVFEHMDNEGRTLSLVALNGNGRIPYRRPQVCAAAATTGRPVAMPVADFEASGERLPERPKRVVAAAEGPTS